MENGKQKYGRSVQSRKVKRFSVKEIKRLSTHCIQQLLRYSCSWVDFSLGCQIRDVLGSPRAILKYSQPGDSTSL